MVSRAVVCPSPPLLAAELTGRTAPVPDLVKACADAVAYLLADASGAVTVVAAGPATGTWDPASRLDLGAFGPSAFPATPAAQGELRADLPLGLGLGAMLLDQAGYTGIRRLEAVGHDASVRECLDLGESISDGVLLVMGDGSARRTPKAPGNFDERAESFDASVEQTLRDGGLTALADLDPHLARDLWATGRAAWQVLAGAMPAARGEILYSGAPFGVQYLVALLDQA